MLRSISAALLVTAMASSIGVRAQSTGSDLKAAFEQERAAVQSLDRQLTKALKESDLQCVEADAADRRLAESTDLSPASLQGLATAARSARRACDDAEQLRDDTRLALRRSRDRLRALALGTAPTGTTVATTDPAELIKKASSAQKRVAELKEKADAAFGTTDASSKAALEQSGKDKEQGAASARLAELAIRRGVETRKETSAAQGAANRLVQESLTIARCAADTATCTPEEQAAATRAAAALARFDKSAASAETANKAMKKAAWGIEADTKDEQARERYIQFQSLLDGNQNAKDLFGKDAFGLTASKDGSSVAFRWTFGESGITNRGANSLVLSTPTSKDGATRVADGLASSTTLAFGRSITSLDQRKADATTQLFREVQPMMRVGYQELTSRDPQSFDKQVQRVYPWALGLHVAIAPFNENGASLHVLRLERQRKFVAGDETVRCPVNTDPATKSIECKSGVFAAPTRSYGTYFSYSYRWKWDKWYATPTFSHIKESGDSTDEFYMPIYLVGASLEAKDGLSGGVSLGRASGSGWKFGLFISAPLKSIFERDWGTLRD